MANGKLVGVALFVVLLAGVGGAVWLVMSDETTPPVDPAGAENGNAQVSKNARNGAKGPNGGKSRLEVVPEVKIAPPPPVKVVEPIEVSNDPEFTYEGLGSPLNNVPWNEVAALLFFQNRELPKLAVAQSRGENVDFAALERAQQRFVSTAKALTTVTLSVDSMTPLSALGHPAVASNAMAKVLEASGEPLTAAQKAQLRELSVQYIAKDKQRLVDLPEDAIWVRRAHSEMDLRVRYLDAARDLLTKEQGRAVFVGSLAHRVGIDPFSPTILMKDKIIPLHCDGDELEVDNGTDAVVGALGFEGAPLREEIRKVAREWVDSLPEGVRNFRPGPLSEIGALDRNRVLQGADITADLFERVLAKVNVGRVPGTMLSNMDLMVSPAAIK